MLLTAALFLPTAGGGQEPGSALPLADGFEGTAPGLPAGWTDASTGELEVEHSRETREPRQGKTVWRIEVGHWDSGSVEIRRGPLPLRAGGLYAAEIWLRGGELTGPVTLSLRRTGAAGTVLLSRRFGVDRSWRRCVLAGRVAAAAPDTVFSVSFSGPGRLELDAFRVSEGEPVVEPELPIPAPAKGNRLYNSSFEVGTAGWYGGEQWAVAEDGAVEGRYFARKLPGADPLDARPFPAVRGQNYSVTAFLRSSNPGARLEMALIEVGNAAREVRTFTLTPEWRRYGYTVRLPCEEHSLYYLSLRSLAPEHGFELDAAQVEEGTAEEYRPAGRLEIAPVLPREARFPHPDGILDVPIRLYAPGGVPEQLRLRYRLEGFYGEQVGADVQPLPAGPPRGEIAFRVRIPALGIHRLVVEALGPEGVLARGETTVTALPPARVAPNPASFFGAHGSFDAGTGRHGPRIAARAGVRWWSLDDLCPATLWSAAEPVRNRLVWSDRDVNALGALGLSLLAVVSSTPRWAGREPPGEPVEPEAWPPRQNADFAAFLRALGRHYRGRIRAYELWNEPWNRDAWGGTPTQYVNLLRAGAAALRAEDPTAQLVGGCFDPGETGFLDQVMSQGLGMLLDRLSYHQYTGPDAVSPGFVGRDSITEGARMLRGRAGLAAGGKKPFWLTEGGVACPPHATWLGADPLARAGARSLLKTLVLVRAAGVERYFYYSVWQEEGPSRGMGTLLTDNWSLLDQDGSGKATLSALATAARFLEGVAPVSQIESRDLRAYVFQRGAGALVVLWSPTAGSRMREWEVSLAPRLVQAYNLMGNRRPLQEGKNSFRLAVRNEPLFLLAETLPPAKLLPAFRRALLAAPEGNQAAGGTGSRVRGSATVSPDHAD